MKHPEHEVIIDDGSDELYSTMDAAPLMTVQRSTERSNVEVVSIKTNYRERYYTG